MTMRSSKRTAQGKGLDLIHSPVRAHTWRNFWRRWCWQSNYLRPAIPTCFVMTCDLDRPSAIFWFASYF